MNVHSTPLLFLFFLSLSFSSFVFPGSFCPSISVSSRPNLFSVSLSLGIFILIGVACVYGSIYRSISPSISTRAIYLYIFGSSIYLAIPMLHSCSSFFLSSSTADRIVQEVSRAALGGCGAFLCLSSLPLAFQISGEVLSPSL